MGVESEKTRLNKVKDQLPLPSRFPLYHLITQTLST